MCEFAKRIAGRTAELLVGLVVLATVAAVSANDDELGPRVGASLSPFEVVKCGGGEDGIEVGETLCYRSRNGIRPQVIVFARAGEQLNKMSELLTQLDAWTNQGQQRRAFVNVLGESVDAAKVAAAEFADALALKKIPIVVPLEVHSGPETYGIAPDKQVTVLIVRRGRIKAVVQDTGETDAKLLAKSIMDRVEKSLL